MMFGWRGYDGGWLSGGTASSAMAAGLVRSGGLLPSIVKGKGSEERRKALPLSYDLVVPGENEGTVASA